MKKKKQTTGDGYFVIGKRGEIVESISAKKNKITWNLWKQLRDLIRAEDNDKSSQLQQFHTIYKKRYNLLDKKSPTYFDDWGTLNVCMKMITETSHLLGVELKTPTNYIYEEDKTSNLLDEDREFAYDLRDTNGKKSSGGLVEHYEQDDKSLTWRFIDHKPNVIGRIQHQIEVEVANRKKEPISLYYRYKKWRKGYVDT